MINRQNWLDTKAFLSYQENTMQNDRLTISRLRGALRPLLAWADSRPFGNARMIEPTYPAYLATVKTEAGKPFTGASGAKTLQIARQFFKFARSEWPARYKSVSESWVQTLQPAKRNAAQSRLKDHSHYSLADVLKIAALDGENLQERRDIAAVAFLFLSGMRIGAFTSLPLECVNIQTGQVKQLPEKGVMTKNRKAAITYLLPIPELMTIVTAWDNLVRRSLSLYDLWYPILTNDGMNFAKDQKYTPNRHNNFNARLKILCSKAGISYLSAHKIRHGHVVYALKNVRDMAGLKAVSQNVMHSNVSITDGIYGNLSGDDIQKIISGIGTGHATPQTDAIQAAAALLAALRDNPDALKAITGK